MVREPRELANDIRIAGGNIDRTTCGVRSHKFYLRGSLRDGGYALRRDLAFRRFQLIHIRAYADVLGPR